MDLKLSGYIMMPIFWFMIRTDKATERQTLPQISQKGQ